MNDKKEIKSVDRKIRDQIPSVLQGKGKKTTKELAKDLDKAGVGSKHYIKARLHTNRDWFPQQVEGLTTFLEEDDTGGNDTRYWRLKK